MHGPVAKHSSTFSSRRVPVREIATTLIVVTLVLVVAELTFRPLVPFLSVNSRTIADYEARSRRIQENEGGPSLLILGNSMSREAIDAELLDGELSEMGLDVLVEHQPADSSIMRDWYYELKNLFIAAGAKPDLLVLPVGDGHPFLRTLPAGEDLLQTFLSLSDLPSFIRYSEIEGFEAMAGVVFGYASALGCFRGRIQKRLFVSFVPGYEQLQTAMVERAPRGEPRWTTQWFEMLAELTDEHGIEVIVIALPTDALGGRLPERDRELASEVGWTVLEPGRDESWAAEEVPDGLHLTRAAQRRFTQLLSPALASILARSPRDDDSNP